MEQLVQGTVEFPKDYYTLAEAAKLLGVSRDTITRRLKWFEIVVYADAKDARVRLITGHDLSFLMEHRDAQDRTRQAVAMTLENMNAKAPDGKRWCTKCQKYRPEETMKVGAHICRPCANESSRLWRAENKEKVKQYQKRYARRHPEVIRAISRRYMQNRKAREAEQAHQEELKSDFNRAQLVDHMPNRD